MNRNLVYLLAIILELACLLSCKKDKRVKRNFTMTSKTFYRFSPTTHSTVTVNGNKFTGFAFVPGGGTGTAKEMGNITTFFNQLAYTTNPTLPQTISIGTVAASVSLVASYPITGGPLPLIQTRDFSAFTTANTSLKIPATDASGKVINTIIYNSNGDALFISPTSPAVVMPISATRLNFTGKASIVGGRGKFSSATGDLDLTGFLNPLNPNDASYGYTGFIEYEP